jgi:xanthosine utilization system XapX-like protein
MNKKYWLREGLIGFTFGILVVLIFSLVSVNNEPPLLYAMGIEGFIKAALPIAIKWCIVGVIIGLIHGKIKSQKHSGTVMK